MIKASYKKYILEFKQASGTSRGVLRTKETWFLFLEKDGKKGVGECGLFRGLSIDDRPDYENKLKWICDNIHLGLEKLLNETLEFPSIQFGLEQAFLSLNSNDLFTLYPSNFTDGKELININGLIWMGDKAFMQQQIKDKLQQGFTTIKMKIGAIDFDTELALLKSIRSEFSSNEIELRVDANGAFAPDNALEKLKRLSELELHSIEQPIKQGQWQEMADLCDKTPLPIALDEELIGIFFTEEKSKCIETIQPQYIILKPSLVGGIKGSNEWIEIATNHNAGNWITSALESNIGLNAIAQWTYTLNNPLPQGLGTGGLFTNNFNSPLEVVEGGLRYNRNEKWHFNL
ncbi:o-succinylbenzoate synthase [Tenacibaculum sp. MAR_2009_124]|uniref:o-succinylbenzoate synthase n=1 Tax=Tenacibaculum sp. MAR_2009_124 TaxID=1250059 RepID=UPI000895C96E|nr:o-succinylbenzoate synthase [Tenacibaculum sp. MAR_2009_124]SEC92089.1 o-succinylbenzoate synthase [Tenacibaculum sp. MAR_2009_124]